MKNWSVELAASLMARHDNIRRLDQIDADIAQNIWVLFQRAYRIEAEILGVEDFPPLDRTLEDIRLARSDFTGLFENKVLAAVSETQTDGSCLSIDGFVVDPNFFRKGFGSQLLGHILGHYHCDSALVETAAANEPAILFYRRFGFTEIDSWETVDGMRLVKLGANLHSKSMHSDQPTAGR